MAASKPSSHVTVRLERDPLFWAEIMQHPSVFALVGSPTDAQVAEIVTRETIMPLASTHGGFLFARLDNLGRVVEMHTAFTPEGWGREANLALKESLNRVFAEGHQVVVTYETADNPRSLPPRSFGFTPAGEFGGSSLGMLRSWVLTCAAWRASPAYLRSCH